jgi:hypothetical protein
MRANRVERFDLASSSVTAEGFLRVEGKLARTGLQEYTRDGKPFVEARFADDVRASLPGFAQAPLTKEHPPDMVTPETARQYAVGAVGDARMVGQHVVAPITVWAADAITAIRAGKQQISVGYTCTLVEEPGVMDGQKYDAKQTDIRVNHVALVDVARCGPSCSVKLDSAGNSACACSTNPPQKEDLMSTTTVTIGGHQVDASAPDAVQRAHDREVAELQKRAAEADAAREEAIAKAAVQSTMDDAAERARKDAEAEDSAKAESVIRVQAGRMVDASRLDWIATADIVEVEKACIKVTHPNARLDGKDPAYIRERYKIAVDTFNKAQPTARALTGAPTERADASAPTPGQTAWNTDALPSTSAAQAVRRYNQRLFGGPPRQHADAAETRNDAAVRYDEAMAAKYGWPPGCGVWNTHEFPSQSAQQANERLHARTLAPQSTRK